MFHTKNKLKNTYVLLVIYLKKSLENTYILKIQSLADLSLSLDFIVEEYAAGKGCYPPKKRRKKNVVYICTIEKASGMVS